jgi:hypothetical protein
MRTLMAPNPDFFLDPTDGGNQRDLGSPEAEVRACWVQGRLRNSGRDDFALVLIEPPLIGQPYGLGDRDIDRVLLATRHAGRTLFPVTEWPALVYVIRVLDESILEAKTFSSDQVQVIRWGVLHKDRPGSPLGDSPGR